MAQKGVTFHASNLKKVSDIAQLPGIRLAYTPPAIAVPIEAKEQKPVHRGLDNTPQASLKPFRAERPQPTGIVLSSAFMDTAHHRGQAEVYLRVKNIKPPRYVF